MNDSKHLFIMCRCQGMNGHTFTTVHWRKESCLHFTGEDSGKACKVTQLSCDVSRTPVHGLPFPEGLPLWLGGWATSRSVPDSLAHQLFASGHLVQTPAWAKLLPRSKQPRSTKCPQWPHLIIYNHVILWDTCISGNEAETGPESMRRTSKGCNLIFKSSTLRCSFHKFSFMEQ